MAISSKYACHVVIPDSQVKPGVPTDFLSWIGNYIADELADRPNLRVIHLGDHADMPSLSTYDKPGSKEMEGRRYWDDIEAANAGFDRLAAPILDVPCDRHILLGNHEYRIQRAINSDPVKFEDVIGFHHLNYEDWGFKVHDFLDIAWIDGVAYSHYFITPMTGRPMGGQAQLQLSKLGHSAISGHQQTLDYAVRYTRNDKGQMRSIHRIIAGASYTHHEDYLGPQGNAHWRGIIVLNEVRAGSFDPLFVSMDYLCRRYESKYLVDYQRKHGYRP